MTGDRMDRLEPGSPATPSVPRRPASALAHRAADSIAVPRAHATLEGLWPGSGRSIGGSNTAVASICRQNALFTGLLECFDEIEPSFDQETPTTPGLVATFEFDEHHRRIADGAGRWWLLLPRSFAD